MVDIIRQVAAEKENVEKAHLENLANNITNVWLQFLSVINKYCQTSGNAT